MLYFHEKNYARFHFYAADDSQQHQSSLFFIPNNQWTTIQLTVWQKAGHLTTVFDAHGKVLYRHRDQKPLAKQLPTQTIKLLSNFNGYADRVVFCKEAYNLPADTSTFKNCLFSNPHQTKTINIHLRNLVVQQPTP